MLDYGIIPVIYEDDAKGKTSHIILNIFCEKEVS